MGRARKKADVQVTNRARKKFFARIKEMKDTPGIFVRFESAEDARKHDDILFGDTRVKNLYAWENYTILRFHQQHNFPAFKKGLSDYTVSAIGAKGIKDYLAGVAPLLSRDTCKPPKPTTAPRDGTRWKLINNRWYERPYCDTCDQWDSVCIHGRDNVRHFTSSILQNMRESSIGRDHRFILRDAIPHVIDGLRNIKFVDGNPKCACDRPNCDAILVYEGEHKLSPDRSIDSIGYSHPKQAITFVSKLHNTRAKHGGVVEKRDKARNYLAETVAHMMKSTHDRIETSLKMKTLTNTRKVSIARFQAASNWEAVYKANLVEARDSTPNCAKCGHELHYGDENGMLQTKNNPHQASPDRRDNENIIYDDFQMVCVACNDVEVGETRSGETIHLTPELIEETIARLEGIMNGTIQRPCDDYTPKNNKESL
jgi:hypothetical protein